MLNIRGLIAVTALSPIIIASTLGLSLSACAPKSRFRPPVNVGGLNAPDDKSKQNDPNNRGAGALNTLSPEDREKAKQAQAAKLGDGSTDESKLKLETAGQIVNSIESVVADVDALSGEMALNITNKAASTTSAVANAGDKEKTTGTVFQFKGNISEVITDAKASVELTPIEGQSKTVKAVVSKTSFTPNGSEDQKSNNLVLGVEIEGLGIVPVVITLNSDNGLKVVRLSEDNKVIATTTEATEKSILDGATATTTISTSTLPNEFSRLNAVIGLTNSSAISVVGSYEEGAKLNVVVDNEDLRKELATEGRVVKLQLPSPNEAQEGLVIEIPYVDTKKPALKLAIGTQENIDKILKVTAVTSTEPSETSPAAQAEAAALEAPPTPANIPSTPSSTDGGTTTNQNAPVAPIVITPTAVDAILPGAGTLVVSPSNAPSTDGSLENLTIKATKLVPDQFIYQVREDSKGTNTYYLYKMVTLKSGLKCAVQRTILVPGKSSVKSLALRNKANSNSPIPAVWSAEAYNISSEELFNFDMDQKAYLKGQQDIASFLEPDPKTQVSEKLNVYSRDEKTKIEFCLNSLLESENK